MPRKTTPDKDKDKALLTAVEACALLGIKAQTLYAYVSRGLLTAKTRPGHSGKLYLRDELEALLARSRARAGHGPTAAGAMRWGEPILESAITCIKDGQIYYRGYALAALLQRGISFERIAELLWSGELPDTAPWPEAPTLSPVASGTKLFRRLQLRLAQTAAADPADDQELLDQTLRRARHLIRASLAELFPNTGSAPSIAAALAGPYAEYPLAIRAIETALIVSADHELNASTFAARVAASTGADLYACVQAALASFSGRKHGRASFEVYELICEKPAQLSRPQQLKRILSAQQIPAGFGHQLYPEGDPRVPPLLSAARELAAARGGEAARWMDAIDEILTLSQSLDCPLPNLDFALVALSLALGLGREAGASLFITGRLVGWTAHSLEQRQQGFLLRPRARYVGRRGRAL